MENEYRLLGITGPLTLDTLKKAYRSKAKALHPDVNRSAGEESVHRQMVSIIEAYQTLLRELERGTEGSDGHDDRGPADSGYAIYRRGIELFQSVHPSKWKRMTLESLFSRMDHGHTDVEETVTTIIQLMGNLSEARFNFGQLVRECPNSPWAPDAKDKLREIDAMVVRYRRIAESYRGDLDTT